MLTRQVGDGGHDIPLSTLASKPSIKRTWPVLLSLSLIHRATSILPPAVQDKLPASLLSHVEYEQADSISEDEDEADTIDTPTPAPRRGKISELKRQERLSGKKGSASPRGSNGNGNGATPQDSPATTELESGEEDESAGNASGPGTGEETKKKKKGLGKAGAARRRKLGGKK